MEEGGGQYGTYDLDEFAQQYPDEIVANLIDGVGEPTGVVSACGPTCRRSRYGRRAGGRGFGLRADGPAVAVSACGRIGRRAGGRGTADGPTGDGVKFISAVHAAVANK